MRFILLSISIILLATCARADILAPGTKWISHNARFENLADYPDYVFFVSYHPSAARRMSGPVKDEDKDKPFPIDMQKLDPAKAETGLGGNPMMGHKYLLAVPKKMLDDKDVKPTSAWFDGKTPGVLQVDLVRGYRAAPESEKRTQLWNVYKIVIVDDAEKKSKKLSLENISVDTPTAGSSKDETPAAALPEDGSKRWYIAGGIGAAALILLVGWLLIRRTTRP